MAMSAGGSSSGAKPNINVTPLIDVLLVLLIIFMIITPSKPSRFEAKVPAEPKPEDKQDATPNELTLVVTINKGETPENMTVLLNKDAAGDVSDTSNLESQLSGIFKTRENNGVFREGTNEVEKTVFVKSPKAVKYGNVVKVIDAIKAAGSDRIGLQVDDLPE